MSRYSIAPAAAMKDKRVSLVGKALLALLGTYTDRNGWCHPKQADLASQLGVSREYVQKTLKALEQYGYIERRSFSASGRGRVALEYRVRTDLSDAQVVAAEEGRCEPEITSAPVVNLSSHRPPRCEQEITSAPPVVNSTSHREGGRCEPQFTADVNSSSHRYNKDKRPHKNDPKENTSDFGFPEIWARWPRRDRSNKSKSRELWLKACARWGDATARSAIDAFLASPDSRDSQYVPAMERWMRDKLESWVEQISGSVGVPPAIGFRLEGLSDEREWRRRLLNWRTDKTWHSTWGGQPGTTGYVGPAFDDQTPDLFQAGGTR